MLIAGNGRPSRRASAARTSAGETPSAAPGTIPTSPCGPSTGAPALTSAVMRGRPSVARTPASTRSIPASHVPDQASTAKKVASSPSMAAYGTLRLDERTSLPSTIRSPIPCSSRVLRENGPPSPAGASRPVTQWTRPGGTVSSRALRLASAAGSADSLSNEVQTSMAGVLGNVR